MSLKITHKYSTAAGTPPASGDIDVGELAINAADAELYTKDNAGNIRKFQNTTTGTADGVQFTQAGSGAVQRTVESKLQDVVSVKDFGAVGDGVTDDTAAIQAAANASTNIYFPPGEYLVSTAIQFQEGTSVRGSGDVIVKDISTSGNQDTGLFEFKGTGLGASYSVTSDLTLGGRNVPLSNVSGLAIGDLVYIITDEIFMGIVGLSGFEPKSKGEMSTIRAITGTTLTLEEPLKDNYTLSGSTLRVVKVTHKRGLSVSGITFVGKGGGNTHTSSVPQSRSAIFTNFASNVSINSCTFSNFARFGIAARCTNDLLIDACRFLGRDLKDTTNQGTISTWFTGAHAESCQSVIFSNNYCENSRRNFDADCDFTRDSSPVCRNIVVSDNTAINCVNLLGTHICENVTFTGNVGLGARSQAMHYRGKNVVISNNYLEGTGETSHYIRIGPIGNETDTSLTLDAGDVIIANNVLRGFSNVGISISIGARIVSIESNTIAGVVARGIHLLGRDLDSVQIISNTIRLDGATSADHSCITVKNTNNRLTLNKLLISSNVIEGNGFRGKGIHMAGIANLSSPLDYVSITGNMFRNLYQNIYLGASGPDDVQGYFGKNIYIANNVFEPDAQGNSADVIDARLDASYKPIQRDNVYSFTSAGVVDTRSGIDSATRTWEQGMISYESAPSAGGFIGSVCVLPGTRGTLNGGATTGDITSGTNSLVVNSLTGISLGCYLTVSGAGITRVQVTSVNADTNTLTLASNASSTVTGAAVNYQAPVFKTFGAITA